MKYITIFLIIALAGSHLCAQVFLPEEDDDWMEELSVRTERKSATTAIILSSIFPGSGHFYVNKKSVGTYLFPVLEIALWAGLFYYDNKGDQLERDYEVFADVNYDRERQYTAQNDLINHSSSNPMIYNDLHFRLDEDDTQHFYEDIGKYNKYIFGWEDWYDIYFADGVQWVFDDDGLWLGNIPSTEDPDSYPGFDEPYSALRQKYIGMRRDAQSYYDNRDLIIFGLVFNRIISSLDVIRVTTVYNRELRYTSNFNFHFQPAVVNNKFTPTMNMTYKF